MIDKIIFSKYWIEYKNYFKEPISTHQEKYKWSVLNQVYKKWDWESSKKAQMFKDTFDVTGRKNLWESGNFYAVAHSNWMFKNFEAETVAQFNNLFNEGIPLLDRINSFIAFYDEKLPELNQKEPDKKINNHYHGDLRAIGLYLSIQYPDKYFLFKFNMVKKFSKKFQLRKIKGGDKTNYEHYIQISNEVLNLIKQDSDFIKTYRDFTDKAEHFDDTSLHLLTQDFIYTVANHFEDADNRKYWRIGSNDGENHYYKEMLEKDYVAIGWNDIGDLKNKNITSKKQIEDLLVTHNQTFGNNNVRSRKAGEIYDFLNVASENDIVALMKGNGVLAIGEIMTSYNFNSKLPFAHYRQVRWLKKSITNFSISDGPQTTFYQLSKENTISEIKRHLAKNGNSKSTLKATKMETNELNQILYGPPGTGKTYKTKELAVKIIKGFTPIDRDSIIDEYDKLVDNNQIHFITFHQSMSYEDFIEGIKPKMQNESNGEIEYEIRSGLFKRVCQLARQKNKANFEDAYSNLIKDITESDDEYLILETPRKKEFRVNVNSNDNLNLFTSKHINKQGVLSKIKLQQQFEGEEMFKGWEGYATSILQHLVSEYQLHKESIQPQKQVIIIDEINRGNVSAIFGELITLIETDKRAGQKEAINVTLPYSQEKFSVPDNVYIIGTMNTADRSVEALDTALRRRFSFIEVSSDIVALRDNHSSNAKLDSGIRLDSLLEKINERIELLIDKDHQIGHSYFINVKSFDDLKLAFQNKIIPLLEEYFYGDLGKIGLVLGEGFVLPPKDSNKDILAKFSAYEDIDFVTDKKIFRLKPVKKIKVGDFISIYEKPIIE